MAEKSLTPIEIGLTAAIVSINDNEPLILTAPGTGQDELAGLPFGPFDAVSHRTFEIGLRAWVAEQTLREWPALRDDTDWQEALTAMIEKARPHGWIDAITGAIKAHVEWPDAEI